MIKLGLHVKETSEKNVKESLKSSDSVFVIKYSGLASPDLSTLRMTLKGVNATLSVVRNNVARRALKEAGFEGLIKAIDGPCGFVFIKDEPANVSRLLCNFVKDHDKLRLEGGFLKDKLIEKKDIEALSKLPAKEVLRAQVVIALKSPITGVVMVLSQTLKKFVYCLDQIKNKKTN
jgi:large subunit ribosomal protein L10